MGGISSSTIQHNQNQSAAIFSGNLSTANNGGFASVRAVVRFECPIGFAQKEKQQMYCLPCIPGKKQADKGKDKCDDCSKGQFQRSIKGTTCLNCTEGLEKNKPQMPKLIHFKASPSCEEGLTFPLKPHTPTQTEVVLTNSTDEYVA